MKIVIRKLESVVSGKIEEFTEENGQAVINIYLSEEVAKQIFKGQKVVCTI